MEEFARNERGDLRISDLVTDHVNEVLQLYLILFCRIGPVSL